MMETARAGGVWSYGGFWRRGGALLLDVLLLSGLGTPLHLATTLLVWPGVETARVFEGTEWPGIFIGWAYFVLFTTLWQATPGKRLLGLQVTDAHGRPPSLSHVLLREVLGRPLSVTVFGLGYAMSGTMPEKRGLHDLIAGTWVVAVAHPGEVTARLHHIEEILAAEGAVALDHLTGVPESQRAALAAEYIRRHPEEAVVTDGVLRLTGRVALI